MNNEGLERAVERLDKDGPPTTAGGFRLALFKKQLARMQSRRPGKGKLPKHLKQRSIDRTLRAMTPAQRRARAKQLDKQAKYRFEVAVGLRAAPVKKVVEKSKAEQDLAAMFSSAASQPQEPQP